MHIPTERFVRTKKQTKGVGGQAGRARVFTMRVAQLDGFLRRLGEGAVTDIAIPYHSLSKVYLRVHING
jgi:hypothetical protein